MSESSRSKTSEDGKRVRTVIPDVGADLDVARYQVVEENVFIK